MSATRTSLEDLRNLSAAMVKAETRAEVEKIKDEILERMDDITVHEHMLLAIDMVASLRIRDYNHFQSFVMALASNMITEMQEHFEEVPFDNEPIIEMPPETNL